MRTKIIFSLLCSFILLQLAAQKTIAIKCGSLLDTKSGQVLQNQTILVKDNKIESVVATKSFIQKTDSIIDLSSYFVLPGLIDCHTHVLLQADITSEDYDVQILKESIPYRTIRAVKSCYQSIQK